MSNILSTVRIVRDLRKKLSENPDSDSVGRKIHFVCQGQLPQRGLNTEKKKLYALCMCFSLQKNYSNFNRNFWVEKSA